MKQSLHRDPVVLVNDVARMVRTLADARARDHGMTRAQWMILVRLEQQPGMSQNELAALIEVEPITVGHVQDFYRDHGNAPHGVCAHPFPGRNVQTVASLIGDLTARELHMAKGSPCRAPYATYTLATCRQGSLSVEVRDRFLAAAGD